MGLLCQLVAQFDQTIQVWEGSSKPKVVIVGAGFGGLEAAKAMPEEDIELTIVDRANHHLFQPLLYQVATAGLSPANIAVPIRKILSFKKSVNVVLAEVTGIERGKRKLQTTEGEIPYDILILATGVRHSYFGHPEWESVATGLKTLDDALLIRRKILVAFEKAEIAEVEEERREWLTFAIVGAGPTGVELAGAIAELAHRTLVTDFRQIDLNRTRIVLIEAGPRVLPTFDPSLSESAKRSLTDLGVEVLTNTRVEQIAADHLRTHLGEIRARTVLWAAGVEASPVAGWLGLPPDRSGRIYVRPDLSVDSDPDIYVIGDAAHVEGPNSKPLPGVSQVAMQQGVYVAKLVSARMKGKTLPPFKYKDLGNMATIGRSSAVADVRGRRFGGYIAWLLWLFVHLMHLVGFANRILVFVQWAWAYLFWDRGARLITPVDPKNQ